MYNELSQILHTLGRIEGTLQAIEQRQADHNSALDAMDTRLRAVETKAAIHGVVGGALAGILINGLGYMKGRIGV